MHRYSGRFRDFFQGESGEEAQLHQIRGHRVNQRQLVEALVDGQELLVLLRIGK